MKLLSVIAVSLALVACGGQTYSVEELLADKELFNQVREACKNGDYSNDSENCSNYRKALKKMQGNTSFQIKY